MMMMMMMMGGPHWRREAGRGLEEGQAVGQEWRLRRGAPCAAVDTGECRLRRASARRRSGGCSRSTAARCARQPARGGSRRNSAQTDGKSRSTPHTHF